MQINQIIKELENWAPPAFQENYDNCGLITGNRDWDCTGILCCLDVTEDVIDEAVEKQCNMVLAHHPIVFQSIKKLSGAGYVQRTVVKAIKNDIAIYAIHTNLDNVSHGVNEVIADKLGLKTCSRSILAPKANVLCKLYTYVPADHTEAVRLALFSAGAGNIGQYNECSFNTEGTGTFKPLEGATPFIGVAGGEREWVKETKLEVVFPEYLQQQVIRALHQAHPYQSVAYEIIKLQNQHPEVGSGMLGELAGSITETELLHRLKSAFGLTAIRHTPLLNKPMRMVAVCGGAGSFLTKTAIAAGADAFITADVKYHEFFDADNKLLLADIGHFESEQFTIEALAKFLQVKFPTFAVLQTEVTTNPVRYFVGSEF